MLGWLIDLVLHLDRHLVELLARYDLWIYPILFAVIFARDGSRRDARFCRATRCCSPSARWLRWTPAARCGRRCCRAARRSRRCSATSSTTASGALIGPPAFSGRYRLLKVEYLQRTEEFFRALRGTRDPAVALHAHHPHLRAVRRRRRAHALRALPRPTTSAAVSCGCCCSSGAATCSATSRCVRAHFGLVTLVIVGVSLLPLALAWWRRRRVPA